MMSYAINASTLVCAAGSGLDAFNDAVINRQSGLRPNDFPESHLDTWIGRVPALDRFEWPQGHSAWHSRNNALAELAWRQDDFQDHVRAAMNRYGADRIGLVVGTSTSSIGRTEQGYRHMAANRMAPEFRQNRVHNPHSSADYIARRGGITGPVMTVSTACSSSAKVFAAGARWLQSGLVDAVVVGGVDSLCLSVLHGFHSLQLVSESACRPLDARRNGINIGEAGGFALMSARPQGGDTPMFFRGYGESSDAYHMSHPEPEGRGAEQAMRAALASAGIGPDEIGYINLHGTASPANDVIEVAAIARVFSPQLTRISSTKGWTGHTLGAAGILEAVVVMEAIKHGVLPGTLNLGSLDENIRFPADAGNLEAGLDYAMTNSFGFGGNNCSLVFSRLPR